MKNMNSELFQLSKNARGETMVMAELLFGADRAKVAESGYLSLTSSVRAEDLVQADRASGTSLNRTLKLTPKGVASVKAHPAKKSYDAFIFAHVTASRLGKHLDNLDAAKAVLDAAKEVKAAKGKAA